MTTPGFPFRFSRSVPEVTRGAPLTGEQTREILAGPGIDGAKADDLERRGLIELFTRSARGIYTATTRRSG